MKILFLNRVYPPDEGATGQLLAELASKLVKAGWDVTVLTSRSTRTALRSELVSGVRVDRVGSLPFTRGSYWKRALSYLALYPALLWRALWLPRSDVIVTLTDPPLHLLLGPVLKWTKGSRLVHWAQDLYPEVAEGLGVISDRGWIARFCRRISTWALRRHDRIIAVGRCMKSRLRKRGLPGEMIEVIANWGHGGEVFSITHAANAFRSAHALNDRFVVMYSGNMGLAHRFGEIIEAAQALQETRPRVLFVFIGAGPRLGEVQEQVEKRRLTNVAFLCHQPLDVLAQSLSAADLHLACMLDNLCGMVVPSKVYGVLAAGRPCIFLGSEDSEVARVIEENRCGSVISSPTGLKLADCISSWVDDPDELRAAGERAQRAAEESNLSKALAAFDGTFRTLCSLPSSEQGAQASELSLAPQQIPSRTAT